MAELTDATLAWLAELNATIRADERAKVAEEIAKAIATNPNVEHSCCDCGDSQDIYAAIARTYATKPAETAVEAPTAHAESHRMGEGCSGAQEAVGLPADTVITARLAGGTPGGTIRAEHLDRFRKASDGSET